MGVVVPMVQLTSNVVRPKTVAKRQGLHSYVLQYMPNNTVDKRWSWSLKFTRIYELGGEASTMEKAEAAARKQIEKMELR